MGDAGLTGRKIIVDTYGGAARHGGGAFSGKDPSKVDRSAAYAARYAAKNVVAAGLADRCEVQVAYAIGVAHPVSLMVQTFGTGKVSDAEIVDASTRSSTCARQPSARYLDLHRPIYQKTAAYGHFGREDATSRGSGPIALTSSVGGGPRLLGQRGERRRERLELELRAPETRPAGPGPAIARLWAGRRGPSVSWRGWRGRPARRRRAGSRHR